MDEWIKIVSTVGFPIAITVWLLLRLENILKTLTDTVTKLVIVLAKKGIDVNQHEP